MTPSRHGKQIARARPEIEAVAWSRYRHSTFRQTSGSYFLVVTGFYVTLPMRQFLVLLSQLLDPNC